MLIPITETMKSALREVTTRRNALKQLHDKARAQGFKHADLTETVVAAFAEGHLTTTAAEVDAWLDDDDTEN